MDCEGSSLGPLVLVLVFASRIASLKHGKYLAHDVNVVGFATYILLGACALQVLTRSIVQSLIP